MSDSPRYHGEYKVPGGKLVVVDLYLKNDCFHQVHVSGDFFMEPPETLEAINQALEGQPRHASADDLAAAIQQVLNDEVMMYGITVAGVVTAIERALA